MTDRDEEWARELWPDEDEYWPPPRIRLIWERRLSPPARKAGGCC